MGEVELDQGAVELLIDCVNDDVSMAWVLIHLGLIDNPSIKLVPDPSDIEAAFLRLAELQQQGLVRVGRTVPNRRASDEGMIHPCEAIEKVRDSVLATLTGPHPDLYEWTTACWVVSTQLGDEVARRLIGDGGERE